MSSPHSPYRELGLDANLVMRAEPRKRVNTFPNVSAAYSGIASFKRIACPACNGFGYYAVQHYGTKTCQQCDGSGERKWKKLRK